MKNVVKLLLVAVVVLTAGSLFAQYAQPVTNFPFVQGNAGDIAPQCVGGIIYDDNTWENGYGWNAGYGTGKWVMKFTPPSYPYTINQICIATTRLAAGNINWTLDLEIWDTTGTGGAPGTLKWSLTNQVAAGVPIWPTVNWIDFSGLTGIPALQNGSYYVGISYDPNTMPSHYVGADESATTPLRPGYGYIQSAWGTIQSYFATYRAMGIRVDGTGQVLAHDYAVGPFLSLPSTFAVGTSYNIKAKVQNLGSTNETSVPIKFFVDNTQAGTVNMSLNAGAVDSVSFPWVAVGGNHTLRIFSELSTDLNRANDTVRTNVFVLAGTPTYGGTVTVCRTNVNLLIPDNTTVRDSLQITIPTWGFGIQDVNAEIQSVYHTWDSDLEFHLIHGATNVNIIDNVGSSGDNFISTKLNDSATIPIASGTAPFTGTYIPSNPLSAFNSQTVDPNGSWTLTISDGASGDTGILNAWCVTLNYYTYVGGIGSVTVPNYYALGQNYPNPFNPSTKIKYALPVNGNVKIVIFDVIGREITTLVNEYHTSGIYEVDFNASTLASGIYFYRIESGSFTDTKKMLLVK
jgi:hypothetical protein